MGVGGHFVCRRRGISFGADIADIVNTDSSWTSSRCRSSDRAADPYERRENWQIGTVPQGGLFLTAGADVQKDRIEVSGGRGLESLLVEHIVIDGGPEHAETWNMLSRLLSRTWLHAQGAQLGLAKLAIDTGYESPAVYAWARRAGHAQVAPIKGVEGFNRAAPVIGPTHVDVTEGGKKLRRGARLWTIAVSTFKSETYLVEAADVLRRFPSVRVPGYFNTWPNGGRVRRSRGPAT